MKLSLISAGHMKRIVNASKIFLFLMIKAKDITESEAFIGCDSKLKHELVEVVDIYDNIFQEPEEFPPKREIQHEIHLQQDAPLPNIGMYIMSVLQNAEIKKKIQEFPD